MLDDEIEYLLKLAIEKRRAIRNACTENGINYNPLVIIQLPSMSEDLLQKINEEGITIFLTSHDMDDILSICKRTIIIDKGKVLLDLPTHEIVKKYSTVKTIEIKNDNEFLEFKDLPKEMEYILKSKNIIKIKTDHNNIKKAINLLTKTYEYDDITITDDSLEEVIRCIYESN